MWVNKVRFVESIRLYETITMNLSLSSSFCITAEGINFRVKLHQDDVRINEVKLHWMGLNRHKVSLLTFTSSMRDISISELSLFYKLT